MMRMRTTRVTSILIDMYLTSINGRRWGRKRRGRASRAATPANIHRSIDRSDKSSRDSKSLTATHFLRDSSEETANIMCSQNGNTCPLNQSNHYIRPMMFVVRDSGETSVDGQVDEGHLHQRTKEGQGLPFDFVLNINLNKKTEN